MYNKSHSGLPTSKKKYMKDGPGGGKSSLVSEATQDS